MFECQDEPARRCSAIVAASGKSNGRRGKLDFDDKKFGEVSFLPNQRRIFSAEFQVG